MTVIQEELLQLDALELVEHLRRRIVNFTCDETYVRNERLRTISRAIWEGQPEGGGLLSNLWIEATFPAQTSSETLATLADESTFDRTLLRQLHTTGAVPRDRPLFTHQAEAIRLAHEKTAAHRRPAIVITAPTGAGKTEAFLLPALNLLKRRERRGSGMRCLILYPMNALVIDQTNRLERWLKGQAELRMFHFTSETPEDANAALRMNIPIGPACRARTRQEARGLETHDGKKVDSETRGTVPEIVITNYSMLEYMLSRPQDAVFFGQGLEAIILDEAHLYRGTLAAEIALLLRRVLLRCSLASEQVLHLVSSATLTEDLDALRTFASKLVTKDVNEVYPVKGERAYPRLGEAAPPRQATAVVAVADFRQLKQDLIRLKTDKKSPDEHFVPELVQDRELAARWREHLTAIVDPAAIHQTEDVPARLLYHALYQAPIVHELVSIFRTQPSLTLDALSNRLWRCDDETARQATIELLRICASARQDVADLPLVPHRIHILVRGSEGLAICLNPNCNGPREHRCAPLGCVIPLNGDRCRYCGSSVLTLGRCTTCSEAYIVAREEQGDLRPVVRHSLPKKDREWQAIKFFTFPGTDKSSPPATGATSSVIDSKSGARRGFGEEGVVLEEITACCTCREKFTSAEQIQLLIPSQSLLQSIIAETIVSDLPVISTEDRWIRPASGRRLLTFSDSRARAAELGVRLQLQHEVQIVRSALARWSASFPTLQQDQVNRLRKDIKDLKASDNNALPPVVRDTIRRKVAEKEEELARHDQGFPIDRIVEQPVFEQLRQMLLDPDLADQHKAEQWSQKHWDENVDAVQKRLPILLAGELAVRPRNRLNAETLGFLEITYPGLEQLEIPSAVKARLNAEARNHLQDSWPALLAALLDTARTQGYITLGSKEDDEEYREGRVAVGHWLSKKDFVGREPRESANNSQESLRRRFITAVLSTADTSQAPDKELTTLVLEAAFDQLVKSAAQGTHVFLPWLESEGRQEDRGGSPVPMVRLNFQKLGVRKPVRLFRCSITGSLWPRSVLGYAPNSSTAASLEEITEERLDRDPLVGQQRREYREDPVFQKALWADEHSAQLAPQETRRRQELFQHGLRNILSATTTLELGIDIGGLSGIFLANVPPGSVNYVQRAGRAGRRADGSSIVVTFIRSHPFDREVFLRFDTYLAKRRPLPTVALERERIVRRHVHAFLLGEFSRQITSPMSHRGAMDAFGRMGRFCNLRPLPRWQNSYPPDYQPHIYSTIAPEPPPEWWNRAASDSEGYAPQLDAFLRWCSTAPDTTQAVKTLLAGTALAATPFASLVSEAQRQLSEEFNQWRGEMQELTDAWKSTTNKRSASFFSYQSEQLAEITLIERLSDAQVLPRYGFPTNLNSLKVRTGLEDGQSRSRFENAFQLERPIHWALQEYVPGSRLLVAGKLVTSHGLIKYWTGENLDRAFGLAGRMATCSNNHTYMWDGVANDKLCPFCHSLPSSSPRTVLFPKYGYQTAAWDPPRRSADTERIDDSTSSPLSRDYASSSDGAETDFCGISGLIADYRADGEIVFTNAGEHGHGFVICTACGYATSDMSDMKDPAKLPREFQDHAPLYQNKPTLHCNRSKHSPLRHRILAARIITDTLLIDFSKVIPSNVTPERLPEAVLGGIGRALQRAGAQYLELDDRELGFIPGISSQKSNFTILLYDTAPGGAGHVYELLRLGRPWLEQAKQILFIDEEHHRRCEHGCLDCILGFDTHGDSETVISNRRQAYELLDSLLEGDPSRLSSLIDAHASIPPLPEPVVPRRSPEERQAQDRQRLREHQRRTLE